MVRFRALVGTLLKLMGEPSPDMISLAHERWDASPASVQHVEPAIYLPDQIDRILATEFASKEHVVRTLRGGFDVEEAPARAYRIQDVDLVDGVLLAAGAQRHLRSRTHLPLPYRAPREAVSGVLYETWNGNRWFGCWLAEDCLAYRLAETVGTPVATAERRMWSHRPPYEARLGMAPHLVGSVHFDDLILLDDFPNNTGKSARARDMRERLIAGHDIRPVPGVFLLRGQTGDLRLMTNEQEIAERLASEYGFLILDPSVSTVDEIAIACGQARVVAGVEGSHLVHGIVVMPQDATLFVIQPPTRATVALKAYTDLRGQGFAFVVAQGGLEGFMADWTEVRRTLDLVLQA